MKTQGPTKQLSHGTASNFLQHTIEHSSSEEFKKVSNELFLRDVPIVLLEDKTDKLSYSFLKASVPEAFDRLSAPSTTNQAPTLTRNQRVLVYSKSIPGPTEIDLSSQNTEKAFPEDVYLRNLSIWPQRTHSYNSPDLLVEMAAIFRAGYHVQKNNEYSNKLLNKPLASELPSLLADALCFSVLEERHWPITKALLEMGADPNRMDNESCLPLHEALKRDNEKAAILLLEFGAKNTKDLDGDLAQDLFEEHFQPSSVRLAELLKSAHQKK